MFFTMETDPLDLANFYAKMSCTKWNRSVWEPKTSLGKAYKKAVVDKFYRLSRKHYRKKYQAMAQTAAETKNWMKFWTPMVEGGALTPLPNTYPWPYNDRHFADWEESDETDNYTLISDPSGCVVKYATSYCAWKIYELTGCWPKRKTRIRMDAKNWVTFLDEAGYSVIDDTPVPGHHYVGVNPREGQWGLVVWYEKTLEPKAKISVSSYIEKRYQVWSINLAEMLDKYIWIRID